MNSLSDEAFKTQVTALVKLKGCEDTHLGEEVDRNWTEVVTQQYIFDRLSREVRSPVAHEQSLTAQQCVNDELWEYIWTFYFFLLVQQIDALKLMTKAELVNWFMEHRGQGNRKLSVHVSLPTYRVYIQ